MKVLCYNRDVIKYPKEKVAQYINMINYLISHDGYIECEACSDDKYTVYHPPNDRNCEEKQCPGNQ